MIVKEQQIPLSCGQLSVQFYGDIEKPWLFCLHGWLDNSASLECLAQPLAGDFYLLLIDFPGHGKSEPLPIGADYYIWQYVEVLHELLQHQALKADIVDKPVHLLGHSLGGIVASLYAGTYPDRVASVVMLDSLGPAATSADQTPAQLAKGIADKQRIGSGLRIFSSVDDALAARKKSSPAMSDQALLPIVLRNLVKRTESEPRMASAEVGYSWRTDKRLRYVSKVRLTEEQIQAFFTAIKAPVLVVFAEQGIIPKTWQTLRLPYFANVQQVTLPGHHHFHCEQGAVVGIATAIRSFYAV